MPPSEYREAFRRLPLPSRRRERYPALSAPLMERARLQQSDADVPSRIWIFWVALCVALSPSLVDAASLAVDEWWARGSLWVGALAIHGMLRSPEGARSVRVGVALVVVGVGLVVLAAGGGMTRLGRPGVPLAVLGMALILGRPSPQSAGLLVFAVAPPRVLMDALPGLQQLVIAAALASSDAFAPDPEGGLRLGTQVLSLESPDGGLPLLLMLAGLGAHASLRRGGPAINAVGSAIRCGLLAIPIQLAALAGAACLLKIGYANAGRFLLSHLVWVGSALLLARIARER